MRADTPPPWPRWNRGGRPASPRWRPEEEISCGAFAVCLNPSIRAPPPRRFWAACDGSIAAVVAWQPAAPRAKPADATPMSTAAPAVCCAGAGSRRPHRARDGKGEPSVQPRARTKGGRKVAVVQEAQWPCRTGSGCRKTWPTSSRPRSDRRSCGSKPIVSASDSLSNSGCSRDPTPGTLENEYKEEHYRRIAYANEHFTASIPGWKTDRGLSTSMFGPPDEIDDHSSGGAYTRPAVEGGGNTSTFPYVQWRYRHVEGVGDNMVIEFVGSEPVGRVPHDYGPLREGCAFPSAATHPGRARRVPSRHQCSRRLGWDQDAGT